MTHSYHYLTKHTKSTLTLFLLYSLSPPPPPRVLPVLQVRYSQVPADEAHFEGDDLSVHGPGVFGGPRVFTATEVGGLRTHLIPR